MSLIKSTNEDVGKFGEALSESEYLLGRLRILLGVFLGSLSSSEPWSKSSESSESNPRFDELAIPESGISS